MMAKETISAVIKKSPDSSALSLVNEEVYLADKQAVREQLPDILGRVLARIWIDQNFHRSFSENPQKTLQLNGVFLPVSMEVEFQNQLFRGELRLSVRGAIVSKFQLT